MKMKKELNKYCPRCNKYTSHTISLYKKGKDSAMRQGARRYDRKKKGYGSQPKPIQKRFSKNTKKLTPRIKCKDCGRMRYMKSVRLKRLEFI
ncbi:MAG: 50S ribosomal protein L44e [Candidatus Hodarchaeota archaeon]